MDHNERIFVTGGTGFVGSYLLRLLLARGYTRIRALRRPSSSLDLLGTAAEQIEWIEGDILNYEDIEAAFEGVDQVYHCAAKISFDSRDTRQMFKVNVEGTANVVNAALYRGIGKLVHVSSIAAIGRSREGGTLTERSKWERSRLNTNYAISKFQSEQEVWRGIAEGLNAAIINPSVILGSGRWDEGPQKFFGLAWKEFPFYGTGITGFVDVRDVVRFMVRLMESKISSERYILSAENLSYGEVMTLMASALDRRPPTIAIRPWIQQIAWRLNWLVARLTGRRPLITKETALNAGRQFFFDNSKSIRDFNFSYTPISETIADTCRQFIEASQKDFTPMVLPVEE